MLKTLTYEPAPLAWERQLDRCTHMTPEQRLGLTLSMSSMEMLIIRQTIKIDNPDATQEELDILFVRTCYGDELANQVAAYLAKRHGTS